MVSKDKYASSSSLSTSTSMVGRSCWSLLFSSRILLFVINGLLFVIARRVRGSVCGFLSILRQGFNVLVQSSIKCITDYHNSSRVRHGTCLQLAPFGFETMYLWSCLF